ncbi:hypothetical protein CN918_30215 [Priestia megaterium]|nr:hypothetical protein CN918_30215 [Priestia megaterium]
MGYIYKRSGHWACRVNAGRTEDGKRVTTTRSGFATREEAEAEAERLEEAIKNKSYFYREGLFVEYAERWLEKTDRLFTPQDGRYFYQYLFPYFHEWKICEVTEDAISAFYFHLLCESPYPLAPRQIQLIHVMLKHLYAHLVENLSLPDNPILDLPMPFDDYGQIQYWSEPQARKFLEVAAESRYYTFFYILLTTGLRPFEALSLRWNQIEVGNTCIRLDDPRQRHPLSVLNERMLLIGPMVMDTLMSWRDMVVFEHEMMGQDPIQLEYVFCKENGSAVSIEDVLQEWRELLIKTDVPAIRLEDLRHTHVHLILERGVHPKIVSERLGLPALSDMLQIYGHMVPGLHEKAAEQIELAL